MVWVALKWGALVGIVTYVVVGIGVTVLGLVAFGDGPADLNTDPGKLALGCTSIFLLLFAFSAAGYFAGKETASVRTGTLAGVISAIIYGVLVQIYAPSSGGTQVAGSASIPLLAEIAVQVVTIALYAAFAAVMGLLGARPGAQRSPLRHKVATPTEADLAASGEN